MSGLELSKTEMLANDGTPLRLVYDQESDLLEIFFGDNESATGIELTDYIILRLNTKTRRPISLMLMHFSILTERTEYGPRSYPLNKLNEIPDDLREIVLNLITNMPVSQFLKISHFQASPTEQIPFTYVESQPMMTAA